jgi:hypothetical protein
MAPMHSGFLEEYPLIRVDNFTASLPPLPNGISDSARDDLPPGATHFIPPHITFLSHCHTDHLSGLSSLSKSSAPIYCSEVTKGLLLALERKLDRQRYDVGQSTKKCPYRSLRKSQREARILEKESGMSSGSSSWDLLHALPFNNPVVLNYSAQSRIRLTLLSANHMPGSTMFLIEGERGAVLHTGDMRAEEHFIQALLARSHLCRLSIQLTHIITSPKRSALHQHGVSSINSDQQHTFVSSPRLCNIYLDTERILDGGIPLTKSEAILDVLQLLRLFPQSSRVHIGCWTSGYEEFLLSLATVYPKEESGPIHVDRYKMGLFRIMSSESEFEGLSDLGSTEKAGCGRFCACEDTQCIESSDIRIEASEGMDVERWKSVRQDLIEKITLARQGHGEWPKAIPLPLQRHSPLSEVYNMIKQLNPVKITANTAECPARFVLACISERLELSGSDEERIRQQSLMGSNGRPDRDIWAKCSEAWDQSLEDREKPVEDKDFFLRVARFRSLLRAKARSERDRIDKERMDAEEGPNPLDVSLNPIQRSASAPGPWSEQGRYAAVDASPFLTPAMRQAAAAKGGLSPEKSNHRSKGPVLTVELCSRYLAYASMFLGWKIRNPSRYRPEVAWRAIRKMRPDLAKQSEEALLTELGLAIPPWDEVTETQATQGDMSLPKTPPLRATGSENRPSTPTGRSKPLTESISPLMLGAAALLRRLDDEAASQDMNSSPIKATEEDIELVRTNSLVNDENVEMVVEKTAIDDFASLELQLRNFRRARVWSEGGTTGRQLFQLIVSEWQRPSKPINLVRFSHQLNLVGVAVRSRRGRTMLSWEAIDFKEAYQALKVIYSSSSQQNHLPIRGKKVLRYLHEEVRRSFV